MKHTPYKHLDRLARKALDEAEKALENAYNPYSHFAVGAALFTPDGQIVTGANFETIAYSSICAEKAAIVKAITMGLRHFAGIAVIARGDGFDTTEVASPCGSCRQFLHELSQISGNNLTLILSTTKKDKIIVATIQELFPLAFGITNVGIDVLKHQR